MAKITDLPQHIIEIIVSKLPIDQIFNAIRVCRSWLDAWLIQRLAICRLGFTENDDHKNAIVVFNQQAVRGGISVQIKKSLHDRRGFVSLNFPFLNSDTCKVITLDSYQGLLLIAYNPHSRLLLANPVSGDLIHSPYIAQAQFSDNLLCGIGYEINIKRVKLLLLSRNQNQFSTSIFVHTVGIQDWNLIGSVENAVAGTERNSSVFVHPKFYWLNLHAGRLQFLGHLDCCKEELGKSQVHPLLFDIHSNKLVLAKIWDSVAISVYAQEGLRVWSLGGEGWLNTINIRRPSCCSSCEIWPARTTFRLLGVSDVGVLLVMCGPGHISFFIYDRANDVFTQLPIQQRLLRSISLSYVPNSLTLEELTT